MKKFSNACAAHSTQANKCKLKQLKHWGSKKAETVFVKGTDIGLTGTRPWSGFSDCDETHDCTQEVCAWRICCNRQPLSVRVVTRPSGSNNVALMLLYKPSFGPQGNLSLRPLQKRSKQKHLQFWRVVNSLKTWKTSKGVFWYSSAMPPIAQGPGHLPGLCDG